MVKLIGKVVSKLIGELPTQEFLDSEITRIGRG